MSKPLSEQVAELEAKQHHLWDVKEAIRVENFELWSKSERLEAENAELRAGQGRWPEGDDSPAVEQVPRVIDAAELHSGASVATFTDCGTPVAGIVTGEATDKVVLLIRNDDLLTLDTERRFILLEDAPVCIDIPGEQVRFKGMTDLRYKGSAPAPRLTVHALNTAPVGSMVTDDHGNPYIKTDDGNWLGQAGRLEASEIMQWADATLTYPKRGDHE